MELNDKATAIFQIRKIRLSPFRRNQHEFPTFPLTQTFPSSVRAKYKTNFNHAANPEQLLILIKRICKCNGILNGLVTVYILTIPSEEVILACCPDFHHQYSKSWFLAGLEHRL